MKFRTVIPALPCEEGMDDDNKDPRVPGLIQAIQDLNRMLMALKKDFANAVNNIVNPNLPDPTLNGTNPILINGTTSAKMSTNPTVSIDTSTFFKGTWMYGAGLDGALSLVADTNLADNKCIRQYSSISCNGFVLGNSSDDGFMLLKVRDTLSLGGGSIRCREVAARPTGGGGTGGYGGRSFYSLIVFANTISGTGSITALGEDGQSGGNGILDSGRTGGGSGNSTNVNLTIFGASQATVTGGAGIGGGAGAGGAGGSSTNVTRSDTFLSMIRDLERLIFGADATFNTGSVRSHFGGVGGGGGGGPGGINTDAGQGGGGGGGGGTGVIANGGGGGAGGAGTGSYTTAHGGQAGAGGGGGGGAGVVIVVTNNAPSTLRVSADGGRGGDGGSGASGGTGTSGGGGGGGGGGAGMAILIAQTGTTATVTATGGPAGASGAPSSGGNPGVGGTAGTDGHAITFVR